MTDRTPTMSLAEWKALNAKPKPKKRLDRYGSKAVRTIAPDGRSFPSKIECAVYCNRLASIKRGETIELKLQEKVWLGEDWSYQTDFSDTRVKEGHREYHEAKGNNESDRFLRTMNHYWPKYGPGPLRLWKGKPSNPKLVKTIYPNSWAGPRFEIW